MQGALLINPCMILKKIYFKNYSDILLSMNNTNYKEKTTQLKTIVSPTLSDTVDLVIPLHIYYKNMMQEVKKFLEEEYDLGKLQ